MDMGREIFKTDGLGMRYTPQLERPPIHGQAVVIDVPGPQGNTGGSDGVPKMLLIPFHLKGGTAGLGAQWDAMLQRTPFPPGKT
jgi:hypothetical protein